MFGKGRERRQPEMAAQAALLGTTLVAVQLAAPAALPPGCVELVFSAQGQARRAPVSRAAAGETAYAFHPGPYETAFAPFPGAPEIGLRVRYLADAADPRVAQQRFDLFLFSEAGAALALERLHGAIAAAVRDALAQGTLDLPACTTLEEWHVFRAGLNELLYTRFGLTVEDCVPVDLGDVADYAQHLRERTVQATPDAAWAQQEGQARGMPSGHDAPPVQCRAGQPAPCTARADADSAGTDARALRRIFLELPAWSAAVRKLALPAGQALFTARRDLLQRCALAALDVNTMPALAWLAPARAAPLDLQARRAAHSAGAEQALDQAWALLARWRLAAQDSTAASSVHAQLLDDADRLAANLSGHLAQRRAASDAPPSENLHREPQW